MWIEKNGTRINLDNVVYYEPIDSNIREMDETRPAYWINFYYNNDYKIIKFDSQKERDKFLMDVDLKTNP